MSSGLWLAVGLIIGAPLIVGLVLVWVMHIWPTSRGV